jgi:O-antigen/teichoic acid export membrane protein
MLLTQESLKEKFIRKGFWIYLFVVLTAPLGYIIKIVLAESISKAEVGILYTAIGLLWLIGTYTDLGLTESLGYFLPKYILRKSYAKVKLLLATALSVQVISSTIIGILLYLSAGWIGEHYFSDTRATWVLEILALFFFGMHILQVNISFYAAIQNTKYQKWIEFTRMFLTMIGIVILFFSWEHDIIWYTWMWMAWVYVTLILSVYLSYRTYYREYFSWVAIKLDRPLLGEFFRYSLGTLVAANIATLLHQLDQQFIAFFSGAEEAGIYTMYLSLISIPFIFFTPIVGFLFPVVSELHESWEKEKLKTIFTFFTSYFSSFMLWISALFFLTGTEIAVFFYTREYLLAWEAVRYIAFFLIWNIMVQICFQFLAGLWHIRKRITITAHTLVVNICLVLFMIWISKNTDFLPSPSSGASLAVGISWMYMWYLSYRVLKEYLAEFQWKLFLTNLAGIFVWWGIYGGFLYKNGWFPEVSSRSDAFFQILFAFSIGLAIFLFINRKSLLTFREMIRSTKNILHP